MKLFLLAAKFLLVLTPLLYFIRGIFNIPLLNNVKDLIIIGLGIFSFFISLKKGLITKSLTFIFFIYTLILINALLQLEDIFFFLVSMRELIIYPVFYILIGIVLKDHLDFNKYFFYGCILCLGLMYLFLVIYPSLSFGLTYRLKAFFDREHLPAIFSALAVIYTIYYAKNVFFKIFITLASLIIISLTGTRSVFLALIFVFVIYYIKFNFKSIITLTILFLLTLFIINKLFTRDIYYNLEARTDQYDLAKLSIEENLFTGIGIDKYGVLGDRKKVYHYRGLSTVTMDSSFIKYFVNIGVPLAFIYLVYLFYLIFNERYNEKQKNILVKRILIFAFLMGTVTGKFGAYPLNLVFFMNIFTFNKYQKEKFISDKHSI